MTGTTQTQESGLLMDAQHEGQRRVTLRLTQRLAAASSRRPLRTLTIWSLWSWWLWCSSVRRSRV
jgi:hypothetical protein